MCKDALDTMRSNISSDTLYNLAWNNMEIAYRNLIREYAELVERANKIVKICKEQDTEIAELKAKVVELRLQLGDL